MIWDMLLWLNCPEDYAARYDGGGEYTIVPIADLPVGARLK